MKRDDWSKFRGLTLAAGVFLILGLSSVALTQGDAGLAQNTSWIRQFGSSYHDSGAGVVVAADGVYIAGYTQGTLAGQTGIGGQDAFLKKYDHQGNEVWLRQFGTTQSDEALALTMDAEGNIYVVGQTSGAFHGGSNAGYIDIFISKYDTSGNAYWTRQLGGADDDYVQDVVVDAAGDVYLTGYTWGQIGNLPDPDHGGADVIVARYDSQGNRKWVRLLGDKDNEYGRALTLNSQDELYLAGSVYSFDSKDLNAFVTRLDEKGMRRWSKEIGSSDYDYVIDLAIDRSGNIYLSGHTLGAFPGQTNRGRYDAFLAKLGPQGNTWWVRQFGASKDEFVSALALDETGKLYVAGDTSAPLSGQTHQGRDDIFVAEYSTAGKKLKTWQLGTSASEGVSGLAAISDGGVYVTGHTSGVFVGQSATGHKKKDAYLMKLTGNPLAMCGGKKVAPSWLC